MKQKIFLTDYRKIANIHADRLQAAFIEVEKLTPLTADKFENLPHHQIAFLDMMTTRFGKLQDIIGARIFPLILDILGEDAETFIDKLNKLEKLNYIEDANWWMALREMRNQITHDYPDDYKILAIHFNTLIIQSKDLLLFWDNLKKKMDFLLYNKEN